MTNCRIHLYESRHDESYVINVHRHEYYQLLYVIEGDGLIRMKDGTSQLSEDHVVVIPPLTEHSVSSDSRLTLLVLAFDDVPAQLPGLEEWSRGYFPHGALLKLNSVNANEMKLLLRKLLFEQRKEDALSDWSMRIQLLQILLLLARAQQPSVYLNANELRAEKIKHYIDTNYFQHITSADLAFQFGISVRYCDNIFKGKFGLTPLQYLTVVRVGVAKKLLAETKKDIVSICFEIGCESLPTFNRIFKNATMVSPSKYRQMTKVSVQ
ncbi:AraC family transcriptional regulator [Cohnella soli]|uniref:AraC family transcriptional regulator n=1 Tax=Cohnella soli TaxID=425005 RepID=A0ABW0HPV2_9BACL